LNLASLQRRHLRILSCPSILLSACNQEIQLEANLNRAMMELAETIGQKLQLQPCIDDGRPAKIGGFSIMSLLDLLL
jgi:recombinational DNA repair protein (RecF pathway)